MGLSLFAQRLQQAMDNQGLNRADLARKADIQYHTLNNIFVRDNALPNVVMAQKIADALGVPLEHLSKGTPITERGQSTGIGARLSGMSDQQKLLLFNYIAGIAENVIAAVDNVSMGLPVVPTKPEKTADFRILQHLSGLDEGQKQALMDYVARLARGQDRGS